MNEISTPKKRNVKKKEELEKVTIPEPKAASSGEEISEPKVLLDILNKIQSKFIMDEDPSLLFDNLLQILLDLTKSEYGFIGEVLYEHDGSPFLKTHSITNIAWNSKWVKFYEENAPNGLIFKNMNTLFGAAIISAKPLISNDPAKDPRSAGLPKGHPPLNAFLGLPFFRGETLIGLIGLANRPGGYEESMVQFLQPFLSTCATFVHALRTEAGRKKAEEELKHSEAKLQGIVSTAVDGIITITDQGIVVSFNPAAEKIFGYSANEVIGKNVNMLMPSPYRENHNQFISNYIKTHKSHIIGIGREVTGLHNNGMTVPLELSLSEARIGEERFFIGILKDISERQRAKAALNMAMQEIKSSHDDLKSILNQLRIGVVLIDQKGYVSFIGKMYSDLLKIEPEKAHGIHWKEVCPFGPEDLHEIESVFKGLKKPDQKIPVKMRDHSGRINYLELEIHDDPRDSKGKIFFVYDMSEIFDLRRQLDEKAQFEDLIGKSTPMQIVFQQIQNLSNVDATVLIQGETGTGKELVAHAIHNLSLRRDEAFIPVNCGGFNESMIASQLFGHKRGAFTGAVSDQPGVFETAHGGTLFLDEIGEIPLNLQPSFLRALQEKEITRLGEAKPRKIDVRLVAATNQDLSKKVADGTFRNDLMYRIQVGIIKLPPLRKRSEDIPLLVSFFLDMLQASTGKRVKEVNLQAMRMLMAYNWPGNVRELRNALESAVINCSSNVLVREDFPAHIASTRSNRNEETFAIFDKEKFNKQRLIDALEETRGNRAAAARLLGIGRTTLYRQLKSFHLIAPK